LNAPDPAGTLGTIVLEGGDEGRAMLDGVKGKVAVVTGGAGGLGLGLARRLVGAGAKVVIADVQRDALDGATAELEAHGDVVGVLADVSDASSVATLRDEAERTLGPVSLLFNNAGVGTLQPAHELPVSAWEWVLGVNLMGVVHGIAAFLPGMVERGEGHIVNTSSSAALRPYSVVPITPYVAAKNGVLGLSAALYYELQLAGSPVRVSVVPLGAVRTNLHDSQRNYLPRFGAPPPATVTFAPPPGVDVRAEHMSPDDAAAQILAGVTEGRFWIFAGWYGEISPSDLLAERLPPLDARFDLEPGAFVNPFGRAIPT
jgi:NAD(P)-dependent dehydrogenase (short-subunit alcohol dehydrogenase family)